MIELPIRVATPDVSHVDALVSGTRLGEFEILGLIGVGGFGMVYRAYDHSLQRDVAIKEYMPSGLANRSGDVLNISVRTSSDDETFQAGLQSFVGEARMLARFEHPSLVKVFRFWEANNTAYMVMPLYHGMTLKQARLQMRLPPTEAWLRKVLWSVLGALKVLHRGTALHRDISPDNIFLQDLGPPVLLDLGAARVAIGDRAKQHTAVLKVNFAPIEQYADIKDMQQGPWTDLYSLAAVVHGLLRNEVPVPSTIRVVNDSMPPFDKIAKTIEEEFGQSYSSEFVTGMGGAFNIRPQDRPQSVQELARALGLATPSGMSSFDWRAELGPSCLPDGEVLQLSDAVAGIGERTVLQRTQPDYLPTQRVKSAPAEPGTGHPQGEAQTILLEPSKPVKKRAGQDAHASKRRLPLDSLDSTGSRPHRSYGPWLMISSLLVVVSALAAWGWRSSAADTATVVATAPDVTPSPPEGAASLSAMPLAPVPPMASPAASIPGISPATLASTTADARPPMAATTPPAAALKPGKTAAPRRSAPTPEARAESPRPATVVDASPAPVGPETPPPRPAPKAEAAGLTAEKLCVDSNFLTRPMCLYNACQKPGLAGSATCVELEQRLKHNAAGSR
ncbi:serine/threonine protein kinase [Rhodoferax ferrireducens]|uniref:serine/threonine protein kinase n=1 Tax=Rhodoferax ferrireducens TaxID=192843 RepID=UPI000E0CE13A|nr:serine/threonine-protein kinase [Rhodoferax ferrireducens]